MKMLFIGVALGYVFHDAIDQFVKQASDSITDNDKSGVDYQRKEGDPS